MTNDTTQPKTTIRELLARWAEVEPGRCEKLQIDGSTVWATAGGTKQVYNPDELSQVDLAWIQWATQAAIIERGWYVQVRYIPRQKQWLASVGFTYDQEGDGPAEAILSAYLKEIEVQAK